MLSIESQYLNFYQMAQKYKYGDILKVTFFQFYKTYSGPLYMNFQETVIRNKFYLNLLYESNCNFIDLIFYLSNYLSVHPSSILVF